ncbi:MAG: response regulator transcription factor [Lysobacteraceae bacterium]|nr:MAG: response regulator transcription factor [Xanthomonadaceae bacterium]
MITRKDSTAPLRPALIERSPSTLAVLAEFRLEDTHCLVVPTSGQLGRALDADACGVVKLLGRLNLDGQDYAVYARTDAVAPRTTQDEIALTSLTARELQIIRLVCHGCVNKQIAYRLHISEYTVKTYLKQIFCKLNVHSRSAMVFRCASWATAEIPQARQVGARVEPSKSAR